MIDDKSIILPHGLIITGAFKGALVFRITKFNIKDSVPLKQLIVTLLVFKRIFSKNDATHC